MRYDPTKDTPGAWFAVAGVWVFVPDAATQEQIDDTIRTLALLIPEPPKIRDADNA